MRAAVVGGLFLFAAGGILSSIFHDIVPLAHNLVGLVGDGLMR